MKMQLYKLCKLIKKDHVSRYASGNNTILLVIQYEQH